MENWVFIRECEIFVCTCIYVCMSEIIIHGCVHPETYLFCLCRGGEAGFTRAKPFNCCLRLDPQCLLIVETIKTHSQEVSPDITYCHIIILHSSIIYMYVHSEIGSLDLISLFQFLIAIQGFRCIVQLHVCANIDARANKTVARP